MVLNSEGGGKCVLGLEGLFGTLRIGDVCGDLSFGGHRHILRNGLGRLVPVGNLPLFLLLRVCVRGARFFATVSS